ncbi:MAG: kynureninase [Gemmatimonadetes bacterium]|nr:kynureninase [Gemmatimonadota bacterium]MYE17184.1 kynureninase [Gemmatimonadota bacterium]MYG23831.1 kynureninase [Gemmatimonadota bacterium]MYJ39046.1 kynureninase [Gemmatimonadota bacterium]
MTSEPDGATGHTASGLARHYSRFRVSDRVLLTGHSHQAWPDVAFSAQKQAWLDAAEMVDDKWGRAFEVADEVRAGYRRLLDDPDGHIALGQNTHELLIRFLSALPLRERPRLVTTDGEFHTIRRQLDRLEAEGIEIVRVATGTDDGTSGDRPVAEGLVDAVDDRTAAVLVSSVLFRDARIVEGLDEVAAACAKVGAELLVDAYHSLNAVPFSVVEMGLEGAFVVGGGYKYCQLGEGNCFLRFPRDCELRPVLTGWFAEFGTLAAEARGEAGDGGVAYGEGHLRFAGSTYDPVSHYRGAVVFEFFREMGLDGERLREISLAQIRRLASRVDSLDLDPAVLSRDRSIPLERRGGFLALEVPRAGEVCCKLRGRKVYADFRGRVLRLGPAPYVTADQLDEAVDELGEVVRGLAG